MEHEHREYLEEICKAIDELSSLKPTPERARCMHDYLYIKKHFMEHKDKMHEKSESDYTKSHFGG